MRITPEFSSVSIVLIGSFNPLIFQPQWFVVNKLVPKQIGDSAQIELIHRELSLFRLDSITLKIEPKRFVTETEEAPFIRASDLVINIFKGPLMHTPIWMLGINRIVDFRVGDENTRNRIGKKLAPHGAWGEWGSKIEGNTPKQRGGMLSLTMEQNDCGDRKKGYRHVKIEPSSKIKSQDGIHMDINDHYEIESGENTLGCDEIVEILEAQFDNSIRYSEWIIDQIMLLKNNPDE